MKKDLIFLLVVVTALTASCSAHFPGSNPEVPSPSGIVRMEVLAGTPTKTAITADGSVVWGEGEQLTILETSGGSARFYVSDVGVSSDGGATMSFGVSLSALSGSNFYYDAVYPSSSVVSSVSASSVIVNLPASQTPASASYDPAADVLLAKTQERNAQPATLQMSFRRPAAIGSLVLQGLPKGEVLNALNLSFRKGGTPVAVAGETTFDLPKDGNTFVYGTETSLVLNCTNLEDNIFSARVTDYNYNDMFGGIFEEGITYPLSPGVGMPGRINFTCWPFELSAGDSFTISAMTQDKLYTRTVTIPAGREFYFSEGDVSLFSVNMASATVTPLPEMISAASFGAAASPAKTDAVPVSSYDAETHTWTVHHVSDFSLLDDDYTYSDYVSVLSSSVSGGTKTITCKRGGATQDYHIVLADYVAPDDSYRPSGSWTLRWNDEFSGTDWDHTAYVRSEPQASYASVHHDRTREDLVTVSEGAVHLWAKSGTNGEAQATGKRNGKDVSYPVLDGYVTGGIRQNYWDLDHPESQDGHTYIRSSEAGTAWRIDARVKMGKANGFWPAVWLIPYRMTRNPHGGEIDLMECATYVDKVYQTVHCTWTASDAYTASMKSAYPQYAFQTSFGMTGWHLFSVVVTASELKYYIDGVEQLSWANRENAMGATGEYPYQNQRATYEGMEPTSSQRTYQYPYNVTDYRLILTAQLGLNSSLSSNDTETWSWMDSSTAGVPDHRLNGSGIPVSMDVDFVRYYTQD